MQKALAAAVKAKDLGEVPVGAIIVKNGEIICTTHNEVETAKDPTAHAEILAIRSAAKIIGDIRLTGCDMYVTLEPCAMCAQAISFARINRLYFGAYDPKGGGVDHGAKVFSHKTCMHKPEVYGGISEQKCADLLKDFFKNLRYSGLV